jgi:metal-dependent hydrolase (beta-lactamase superfamily II)
MSSSILGNSIHLNQNVPLVTSRVVSYHNRVVFQDIMKLENFEDENRRKMETRETEEAAEVDNNLIDSGVYSVKVKYGKRKAHKEEQNAEDVANTNNSSRLNIKA